MHPLTDAQLELTAGPGPDPAASAERADAADHVLSLVRQLPEKQQEVVRLKRSLPFLVANLLKNRSGSMPDSTLPKT